MRASSVARTRIPGEIGKHLVGLDINSSRLSKALCLVQARDATAQLCIIHRGEVILDGSFGCEPRSLFWIFSASKPYIAMMVHLLAERGRLSLDEPVALHWPEFAAHGKEAITIRHVLQHRSGLSIVGTMLGSVLTMTDWHRSRRRIEQAKPRWPAGTVPAYQPLVFGFILGELVERITGQPIAQAMSTELLQPLRVSDTYLGVPHAEANRCVPIVGRGFGGRTAQAILNRASTRRAIIPAAGISTTARDLARFYLMLLRSGTLGGDRILGASTINDACTPSNEGQIDQTAGHHVRWSNGFQLGGPRIDPASFSSFGRLSSPTAFGHNGSNCCVGWADPSRDLVFAYLTNRLSVRGSGKAHLAEVADALISACS